VISDVLSGRGIVSVLVWDFDRQLPVAVLEVGRLKMMRPVFECEVGHEVFIGFIL